MRKTKGAVHTMRMRKGLKLIAATTLAGSALIAAGCGGGDDSGTAAAGGGCDGTIDAGSTITVQWHQGAEAEVTAVKKFVKDFNASQTDVKATLKLIPEADYATSLSSQAQSGEVPDVVDTDASKAFQYAFSGDLQPITNCIDDATKADLLPSVVRQGEYAGQTWAVGMFDSGLGLYTTKSALKKIGATAPTIDAPWTAAQFTDALKKWKAAGYSRPLDVKKNYGQGEWYAYGFAPIVWSGGGNLLSEDNSTAEGQLNSEGAVAALTTFQSWFKDGLVGDNAADTDFLSGKAAVSWVGHWQYVAYKEKFKDDLVVVPIPDFGSGLKTSQGSWQWAMSSTTKDPDAAWAFIKYTLQAEQQKAIAAASGAIPASKAVADADPKFKAGGDLNIFVAQHAKEGVSVPRPTTPAYITVSDSFNQAIQDIIDGADVKESLDKAVKDIDTDISDNDGYPDPS
jgi:multiple sugar transport system substrate-binding protein